MQNLDTADHLPEDIPATVLSVALSETLKQRLEDLGLMSGTTLRRTITAPGGSPIAFSFRGSIIALRASDASQILCKWEVTQ